MRLRFIVLSLSLCLGFSAAAAGQDGPPLTRAERTDFKETSLHADVMEFLEKIAAKGGPVTVRTIGKSTSGKPIPLATAAHPAVGSAAEARRAGKVVVYIQANIHAGEVEGKEATLMLLRELAGNPQHPWLEKLVILAAPIYNIDGNDLLRDGARVRGSQDGPERVGMRASGQGFDLNRDAIKAESLEMRALLEHVYYAWEPDVMFDLHTTNGTRHGFDLTYAPPLNPNTDADVLNFAREELLPGVRKRVASEQGKKLFDYGNRMTIRGKEGWYSVEPHGRYITNYIGLRNRIAVLSEATSFQPFGTRVEMTVMFVKAVLDEITRQADRVTALSRAADERMRNPKGKPELGVRFEFDDRGQDTVPLEALAKGERVDHHKAPRRVEDHTMTVFDRFKITRTTPIPAAYLVPADLTDVLALLRRHGVTMKRLDAAWHGPVEAFSIAKVVVPTGKFEGHHLTHLEGQFVSRQAEVPAGTFLVPTAQPLGTLAASILEPESLDGAVTWEFLTGKLKEGSEYPILKASQLP
jgi:hypothetical protein